MTRLAASDASEDLFRKLFHKHSSIMLLIDPATGVIADANLAAAAFYQYDESVLRGMKVSEINIQPENEVREEMRRALHEQRNYFIFYHRLASGDVRTVEVHSSAIEFKGKSLLFSIVFDVTKRKQAEDSLQLASMVYQNSSEAMSVVDGNGDIININPAFTEITGYQPDDVVGRNIRLLNSEREKPEAYASLWSALATGGRWQGELWARRKDGTDFLRWLSVNTIYNPDGSVQCRVGLFSDITRKRETDELIWRQANFDALTGLPNRSMFHDRLEQSIKKAHRAEQQFALLFLDLDYFKEVNDTLGHGMGDRLLQVAAERVSACVRDSDTVARLGGDEFTVILGELCDTANVERAVHSILQTLAEPFQLGTEQVYISASIGITFYPDDGTEIDTLLKNADQAMYAAKAQGRNRYSYFTASMQQAAQARKRLVSDLRAALNEKQFCVHYQPIVDLASGEVRKAEALVRWLHPVRGPVSPAEFIPLAEETGMIVDLGEWMFREAARQTARWRKAFHPNFQISVNVSPVQFQNEGLDMKAWLEFLGTLHLPGQSVAVEITEGLLMDASASVSEQLLQFRDHGVQVALDDFGTGYSSLAYLKKFDIDYLKIDQAFVRNLAPGSDDLALCEAIIVMAHKLGIKVIAEGVETEEQRQLLLQSKCDFGQGYLFSRPVDGQAFEQFLSAYRARS
ncbi:putative bifunctional diguanylate cyclase/phosphodiesterase [Noviherbaspirillum sp. ST9]|uniref:putative bifunctional diguanylate cyclase/phosphodiesterase n=1 Tax=Noviherbaspirillum sp. ST9 TaxID=3401606 RepID=UPI003B585B5C